MEYNTISTFWFTELSPKDWYQGGEATDQLITERFADWHTAAAAGEFWQWRTSPEGALAEVLILDQFSRNMFRGTPQAFAADAQALVLAQEAIAKGFDQSLSPTERQFLYMPFMHSESKVIHEEALRLFTALGNAESLKYEQIHKDIIDRFGRYPHRNQQLGRQSTPEEESYLNESAESFFKS